MDTRVQREKGPDCCPGSNTKEDNNTAVPQVNATYLDVVFAQSWDVSHEGVLLCSLFHVDGKPHIVGGLLRPLFKGTLHVRAAAPLLLIGWSAGTSAPTIAVHTLGR